MLDPVLMNPICIPVVVGTRPEAVKLVPTILHSGRAPASTRSSSRRDSTTVKTQREAIA